MGKVQKIQIIIQEFPGSTFQEEGRGQGLHASRHTSALQVLCRYFFIPVSFRENSKSRKQLGSIGVQITGDRTDTTFKELAMKAMVTRGERGLH